MDKQRRLEISDSYLYHILIALKVRDFGAPFQDFLDNWYSYRTGEGHLNSGGRPIWFNNPCAIKRGTSLSRMHYVSDSASKVLKLASLETKNYSNLKAQKNVDVRLMMDHAVPLSVLTSMMLDDNEIQSEEKIEDFLLKYYRLGVLTYSENERLNKIGLTKSMPKSWNGENVFARYDFAKIKKT